MLKEEKNLNQSEITTDDDFKKISEEFEKEKEAEYEKKKGKIYYGDKNNFVNQYAFVATALRLLREDYLNGNLSDKEINQELSAAQFIRQILLFHIIIRIIMCIFISCSVSQFRCSFIMCILYISEGITDCLMFYPYLLLVSSLVAIFLVKGKKN